MAPAELGKLIGMIEAWEASLALGVLKAWSASRGDGGWVLVLIDCDGRTLEGEGNTLDEAEAGLTRSLQAASLEVERETAALRVRLGVAAAKVN